MGKMLSFIPVAAISRTTAFKFAAYLDPSAMTYVIQVIAGIVIAGGAGIAVYWKKIRLYIKKRKSKKAGQAMKASDSNPE